MANPDNNGVVSDSAMNCGSARVYYCYALFREDGSPFYIGKGSGRRCWHHVRDASPGKSHKDNVICGMLARGVEIPVVKLAVDLTNHEAIDLEVTLIRLIGRWPRGPLTNLTDGGEGQIEMAPETRAKISAARRGRKASAGVGQKISAALTGTKRTDETRARMRESRKKRGPLSLEARANIAASQKGKTLTAEAKTKISDAMKRRRLTPEHRAKIGDAHRGRKLPLEQVEKMRASKRGTRLSIEHRTKLSIVGKGRVLSPEHRAKIGAAQMGKKRNPESMARAVASKRTPEYRLAASARAKAQWARRRSEQQARD